MREELLEYYVRELTYVRQMGIEFARKYQVPVIRNADLTSGTSTTSAMKRSTAPRSCLASSIRNSASSPMPIAFGFTSAC